MPGKILIGKTVTLRPIEEDDLPILFEWRNSSTFLSFCSFRKKIVSLDSFKEEIRNDLIHDRREQYIIQKNLNKRLIGTVFLYALMIEHGNAFITIYISESQQFKGYGIEAFLMYVVHVMEKYSLHKILADVYSNNTGVIKMLRIAGFVEEGCFREHRISPDGGWLDMHRFALFEDDLKKIKANSFSYYTKS